MSGQTLLAVLGILGTLGGTLTVTLLQQRAARIERADRLAQDKKDSLINAVTTFVAALTAHRRTMWHRERLRLTGADDTLYQDARSDSHRTREEITAPLVTLSILAPSLAAAANTAARTTYAMRAATDEDALDAARAAAAQATEELIAAAAEHLA
ncbi:protein kilB [Kitasatospora purpeofusca]|uniref:protein kilB n=1 Tax=Kitasatospora purpeofusca TaxID=67352 RepID=UPI0035D68E5C